MTKMIDKFRGENRFLSSFWPAKVSYSDVEYDCVEKAYVAAKFDFGVTVVVDGEPVSIRELARNSDTAGKVKRLGRKYKDLVRPEWDEMKLDVMGLLVEQKFSDKNPELVKLLLETGDAELVEGNTWGDTYWGIVTGGRNKNLIGKGENHLGKLLMARRESLQLKKADGEFLCSEEAWDLNE
jgi:ribA/ribD-fused uncharacterized protein